MKRTLLCIVLFCFAVVPAFAQLITWNTSSITTTHGPSPWDPTTADPNLTITGLTRGTGLTTSGTGISGNKGWGANGFNSDGTSQADKDFSFTMTTKPGYKVSLSNFKWSGYRRSSTAPSAMKVYYSINGGADVEIANWASLTSTAFNGTTNVPPNNGDISLSAITDLQNVPAGSIIKFRMLPSGSQSVSGNFYLYYSTSVGGVLSVSGTVDVDATPPPTNIITTTPATYGPYCVNTTTPTPSFNVAYTTTGTYTGNYKVQLSNIGGIFPFNTTDNIIGTGTTSPISAAIPAGTTTGAGYRVRVINDNPVTYGSDNGSNISVSNVIMPTVALTYTQPTITPCAGETVPLSATVTNGTSPTYQWKIGATLVGTNSSSFVNPNPYVTGDVVTLTVTNNATCPSMSSATTSGLTFTIIPVPNSSVSIATSTGSSTICGTSATFTATPILGGTAPTYDWYVGAQYKGTGNPYTITGLATGDVVTTKMMNVNLQCASPNVPPSNPVNITVTSSVTPSVSVAANPGNTICAGTSVTFTATPANGGTTPIYVWKKGTVTVGTNSTTYTDNGLASGDAITVAMTSNAVCPTTPTVTSTPINMQVAAKVTPAVNIAANPGNNVCEGTSVTFTATPVQGGTTPVYEWKKGTTTVGTNSTTYTDNSPANGDVITAILTSNATCTTTPTVTSSPINMQVATKVTPGVSIAANPNDTICAGTSVTFTATPANGGTTPVYAWKKGSTSVGTNSTTYTDNALAQGDVVSVTMTSSETCVTATTATYNVPMAVNPMVVPSVNITANPGTTIAPGTSVTFTAVVTSGGAIPAYQWQKNGADVGTQSNTYTTNTLANNDVIKCVVHHDAMCAAKDTAHSNSLTMKVATGIEETVSGTNHISLYPNPNKGVFTIEGAVPGTDDKAAIEIINALGQVVYSDQLTANNGKLYSKVNLSFPAGLYILQVHTSDNISVKRFLITHE